MKLIAQGNTAEIYEVGEGKILKLYREGLHASLASQEYENSKAVYETLGELVPKVYDRIEYEARQGIIYEKIEGKDMLKMILSDILHISRYSRQMAKYHVDIQREVTKTLPLVKDKLKRDIEAVIELDEDEKRRILDILTKLPEGNVLCHMDFHPGNILLREKKPVIIDWMTACVGNPCADVARTSVMLQVAVIPGVPRFVNYLLGLSKRRIFRCYIAQYLQITGFNMDQVKEWYLPIMAARLREWIPESEKKKLLSEIKRLLAN